jgi:beta-N-acetylhexosaminidase
MTLVMVGSASFPRALGPLPAVLTRATYDRELPAAGVPDAITISDDLETPSVLAHSRPSRRAVIAGLDLLLYARTEAASAAAYPVLLADVRAGRISEARVREAAGRIARLKDELAEAGD